MEGELSFPMVLAWAVPFFVATVALEWWGVRKGVVAGRYDARDALTSMTMGLGNLVTDLAFGALSVGALMWVWQFRLFDLTPTLLEGGAAGVAIVLFALLCQDFFYYWKHRFMHRIRWFWSAHVVHHSSEEYNLTTALRQPWNNHFTGLVLLSAPLVLLGFHPALFAFVASLNLLYQYWIHTQAVGKLPRAFEFVMNTPSHHRVHHSTHPEHLDRNYAGILIIWDRIFGTFAEEETRKGMRYGLVKNIGTHNPLRVAFAEMLAVLRDATRPGLSLRQRLGLAFAPPGWSPTGDHNRSEEIRARYLGESREEDALLEIEAARAADA